MNYNISLCLLVFAFSSCSKNNQNLVYRKPIKGYVHSNFSKPIENVSIRYDSLDLLSSRDIKSNKDGLFVFPKILAQNKLEFKKRISKLSSKVYLTKKGYKTIIIDLNNFEKSEIDTIFIDTIYMEFIE